MLTEVKRFLVSSTSSAAEWNLTETIVSVVLFVAAVQLIHKASKAADIEFNKELLQASAVYAFIIAALSVTLNPFLGIALGFTVAAVALLSSYKLSAIVDVNELLLYKLFGTFTAIASLPLLNYGASFTSAAVFLPFAGAAIVLSRSLNPLPVYAIAGQYFDAATSFVVLSSGGTEMHILGSYFVDAFGPQGIFAMKTVVVVPATLYIYRISDKNRRLYYMSAIGFLGLALGLANLFRA